MRRLQTREGGKWHWVFGRRMPERTLMLCDDKAKALPPAACHAQADLEWAQHNYPDREFRLAETLED